MNNLPMRQIVLDTETTGLNVADGHCIIEVAGIELYKRRPTGNYFHKYIRPRCKIDPASIAIHGITESFLADKPLFHEIIQPLLTFIRDAELIIHNAPFDVSFLNREFSIVGEPYTSVKDYCSVVDTLVLARKKHPGQQNSLDALCKRYSIDNSGRQYHGALLDAHLLARVYLAMTGGQYSLFEDTAKKSISSIDLSTPEVIFSAINPLTVLPATREEIETHQARLANIKKKHGICYWLDKEESSPLPVGED